jgi:Raf kinase inhibitor-like YbhB/YbcL family protein
MILESPEFQHQAPIPAVYTCQGKDLSPPLKWRDVPAKAKSLALIVDDPDAPDPAAPQRVYVHWVVYNIPIKTSGLESSAGNNASLLPAGAMPAKNDWGKEGYGGPCPPIGRHRYFFKLYALDTVFPDLKSPTKKELEAAMQGHIIEQIELIGTYQKS